MLWFGDLGPPNIGPNFNSCGSLMLETSGFWSIIELVASWDLCISGNLYKLLVL